MFISARATSEYSILECPTIRPLTTTKWKSNNIELAPNCPRCASSNTKFCYYNNYSLSQPRYFCKGCRRYWTKGGSLRNVPVGGGCRKSRRSRAARLQGSGQNCGPATDSATYAETTNESENGANIDLAAVFAKYVNPQNLENQQEEFSSTGGSCSASASSSDNFQTSSMDMESQMDDISTMFEYQKPVDMINVEVDDQLQQVVLPQISMHEDVNRDHELFYQNSNAFDHLQSILGDGLSADMFWADSTNFPNFGSQQPMEEQLQDFELFSSDDQLRIPANLVSDSWTAFDPSGYEIFSRP